MRPKQILRAVVGFRPDVNRLAYDFRCRLREKGTAGEGSRPPRDGLDSPDPRYCGLRRQITSEARLVNG